MTHAQPVCRVVARVRASPAPEREVVRVVATRHTSACHNHRAALSPWA